MSVATHDTSEPIATVAPSTIGRYLRVALVLMVLGWILEMVKVITWWR